MLRIFLILFFIEAYLHEFFEKHKIPLYTRFLTELSYFNEITELHDK